MPPGPPGKEERATLFLPLLLLSGLFYLFLELLVGFPQVEGRQVGYGFGPSGKTALRAGLVIAGERLAAISTLCHEVSSRFIQDAQANFSHW